MAGVEEQELRDPWWAELEELENYEKGLNWCCRLILHCGFEEYIQREIGVYVALRFGVNYCPHCGTKLRDVNTPVFSDACCNLFKELGLEGIQYEETEVDQNGEVSFKVHRLMVRYCFNCGKRFDEKREKQKGAGGACSGDCENCI
ncbi:MAG: hypothetical protein D6726_12085 [Nitrospirae bacterium]|nr:MAG: hypothetical protein D6726_12085 [Nitrospirota bacterium]